MAGPQRLPGTVTPREPKWGLARKLIKKREKRQLDTHTHTQGAQAPPRANTPFFRAFW